ncbi:recombination regulator RecX, partial [Patescibacteria group bacterium]|nr:recombination regulator RecX [Patescibacteria group bacterium]
MTGGVDNIKNKLLSYSLRLVSKKRYTVAEMTSKLFLYLEKRGFEDEGAVGDTLARLGEFGYLDDGKFAADYVSLRVHLSPRGKFVLRRELKKKGISKDLAQKALDEAKIDELEIAKGL